MKEGILAFNFATGRYDVRFDDGGVFNGLSCGDTFRVYHRGEWTPTRIEYDHSVRDWYLDLTDSDPCRCIDGLRVKIRG